MSAAEALPAWLPEAIARYEAGEGCNTLDAEYHAKVHYWFKKVGVATRSPAEAFVLRRERETGSAVLRSASTERITEWINAGRNAALEDNLARLAASNADDEAHAQTAYIESSDYWTVRWGGR
jgi:hypothetical protein